MNYPKFTLRRAVGESLENWHYPLVFGSAYSTMVVAEIHFWRHPPEWAEGYCWIVHMTYSGGGISAHRTRAEARRWAEQKFLIEMTRAIAHFMPRGAE